MEFTENTNSDFFYSAMMLNTDINYKTLNDLTVHKAMSNYRDMHNIELLKEIVKGNFDLKPDTVHKVEKLIDSFSDVEKIAKSYKQTAVTKGIEVMSCLDRAYPYNWKHLSGMPKVFYYSGNYNIVERMTLGGSVAVVGSRSPSRYAEYATEQICKTLGNKGIAVVSGMAYGIDRKAHMSSIGTAGGTVAVLAGGVDNIYPPKNKDIYEFIRSNGLIISEMPPGQQPLRQYFPSRNRLIAGLSDCTLVMEAGAVSGTLHTASFAASQGKEVFVLPNNIYYENALGGLKLLEDGGNVLLSAESVIDSVAGSLMYKRMDMGCPAELYYQDQIKDEFGGKPDIDALRELSKIQPEALTDDNWKALIKDSLTLKPMCADELCVLTMLPFYKVSKLLTELELNGTVCQEKGKYSLTFV